jgi:imidazolonepropionase-like amidohydrolase
MRSLLYCACAALLAASLDVPAAAQEPPTPPVAIVHAKVYVPGGKDPLPNGTVVIDRGKILLVGDDLAPPPGARVIDGRGKVVTPGFIDAESDVGVVDVDGEEQTDDSDMRGDMNPAVRMVDGYNPRSTLVPITRVEGVTSVVVAPRGGVLGGQSAFADLAGDSMTEAIVRPVLAQYASVAEGIAQSAAGTRGGLWNMLREALEDARFYATHRAAYDINGVRQLSLRRAGLEALVPVVQGNLPLVVHAHRASDIEAALLLAGDLKLKIILSGASEAWMIADDLARRKVPVIVDPLEDLPERFDRLHARSDNAAILERAGVRVIIATYDSHQSRLLWQHAGNAVRTGMDHDAAIRAVTETPADAFGLKGYGRLEKGAVANVVIWSGDPLQLNTHVEHVFVHGKEQSLETRQILLRDRYRTLPVPRDGTR